MPGAEPGGLRDGGGRGGHPGRAARPDRGPVSGGSVVLPSLGAAVVPGGRAAVVRSTAAGTEVRSADVRVEVPAGPDASAPGWLPLHRIQAGSLRVVLDDLDPFRMPAVADLPSRLSASEASRWEAEPARGWPLLDPSAAAEVAAVVPVIVPSDRRPGDSVSSSSPENFGAVGDVAPTRPLHLRGHPGPRGPASEAVRAARRRRPDLPDDGRRYYAPWRNDPRPASACFRGPTPSSGSADSGGRNARRPTPHQAAGLHRVRPLAGRRRAGRRDAAIQRAAHPPGESSSRAWRASLDAWQRRAGAGGRPGRRGPRKPQRTWLAGGLTTRPIGLKRIRWAAGRSRSRSADRPRRLCHPGASRADRLRVTGRRLRSEPFRFPSAPSLAQVDHQVRGAAQGHRMGLPEQPARPVQRVLAQCARVRGVAERGKVAGQVGGHGQRVVVVAGQPAVKPVEGAAVKAQGLRGIAGPRRSSARFPMQP